MTNLSITMVRSEEDIIESFVRYNSRFIDIFIIIDNNSSDNTRNILLQLQREGYPIVLMDDPLHGRFQSAKMTFFYQRAAEIFQPSLIFLLDADEFIIAHDREHIDALANQLTPGSIALATWRVYVLTSKNAEQGVYNPLEEIQYRRKNENPIYYKVIISVSVAESKEIIVEAGNHSCRKKNGELPKQILNDIFIGHFPVRSRQQLASKAILGWFDWIVCNRYWQWPGFGYQKKILYDRFFKNDTLTNEELCFESYYYDQDRSSPEPISDLICLDPLPVNYELRYTPRQSASAFSKILAGVELMLGGLKHLKFDTFQICGIDNEQKNFTSCDLKNPLTVELPIWADLPPLRYILEKYQPGSMMEINCNNGAYLHFARTNGVENILGVTDSLYPELEINNIPHYTYDNQSNTFNVNNKFDLVVCHELATLAITKEANDVVANIIKHANKHIVLSMYRKDPQAVASTSKLTMLDWIEKFKQSGWYPQRLDSLALRLLATYACFRRDLVLLAPNLENAGLPEHLLASSIKDLVPWHKHAVITHPMVWFSEIFPPIKATQLFTPPDGDTLRELLAPKDDCNAELRSTLLIKFNKLKLKLANVFFKHKK